MLNYLMNYVKKIFINSIDQVETLEFKNKYYINDPTTPELAIELEIPKSKETLKFSVIDYSEVINNDVSLQAANCYITTFNSIAYIQSKLPRQMQKWASVSRLKIIPRAGKDYNAYYDRRNLKFFYGPAGNKVLYTVDSADIVAHELGHAILDALRPDFWSVQSLEIWSFHEAFADINAILSAMQYDKMLEHILAETNGDLRKSNALSRLAEEMGNLIHKLTEGATPHGFLRNAINDFKYTDPNNLPKEGPDSQLVAECHSFGRVFLGAWYEILVSIYEIELQKMNNQIEALKLARDICTSYLLHAVVSSPRCNKYHHAIAKAMLAADEMNGLKYQKVLMKIFVSRNILQPQVKILSNKTIDDVKKENYIINKVGNKTVLHNFDNKIMKLKSAELSAMSINNIPISDIGIEVALDSYYEFDEKGNLIDEISSDEESALESAQVAVLSIQDVGQDSMWNIDNQKLTRNYII